MNMRLIDCEELFPDGVFVVNQNKPEKSLDELLRRIQNAHAVDVVQCKKCKYWWEVRELCVHPKSLMGMIAVLDAPPDHFCGYGELRKGKRK